MDIPSCSLKKPTLMSTFCTSFVFSLPNQQIWTIIIAFCSLKWYKDDIEFYSYIPRMRDGKKQRFFDVPGILIDVSPVFYGIREMLGEPKRKPPPRGPRGFQNQKSPIPEPPEDSAQQILHPLGDKEFQNSITYKANFVQLITR